MFPASSPWQGNPRRDLRSPRPKRMARTRIVGRMSTLVFTDEETFLRRKGHPFNFISPAPPPCSRRPKRRDAAKKELVDVLRA